jgi:hypothetical protein
VISTGGTVTIDCTKTNNFYDSGNSNSNYGNNENYVMTFSVATGCLTFNFTSFATESCCDKLKIFDGPSGASPLIGTYNGTSGPGSVTSSGSTLTFSFTSDFSTVNSGWVAGITCSSPCSGSPTGGSAAITPSSSCVAFTSALSLSGNTSGCGITYQWQQASALAGPYSNISGAVTSAITVTNTATTYYRCVVACGSSTAASSVATASLISVGSCGLCNVNNIGSLPFSLSGQTTCGEGNNITSSNVSSICGSSSYYGGEDAVYSFTPAATGVLTVGVNSTGSYMGIMLYNGCPISGGTCMGSAQSAAGNQSLCLTVTAGQVYYLVIDSWPSPTCNPYDVSVSAPGACFGSISGAVAAITPTYGCGTLNSTLTLSGYSACGPSFQWQSASASAGPWTNISGATSSSAAVTSTAPTFYRCILSCGSSTAASTTVSVNVNVAGACGMCGVTSVASLPFSLSGQTTCGAGNDVTSSNVTNICGSSSYYGGEDAVYTFTPASTGAVTIGVTSSGSYMGLMVYSGCPNSGGSCVGNAQSSSGNQTLCVTVTAGQTYFLIIDSWPSPTCNPYNVSISAPSSCFGTITGASAAASPATGCGTVSTVVSLSGFSACGPTFQWTSASSASGPFTVIPGATAQTYSAAVTNTTYFQAILTCGSSTALSTVAGVSVSPVAAVACALSTYTTSAITYSFETFTGTTLPTTDDVLFNTIVYFGFPFCYGGSQYWGGYVASNSSFVFDAVPCFPNIQTSTYAAGGVSTGYTIPSAAPVNGTSIPRNAILAPWHDVNPGLGGTMRYYTTGTAPNRKFVVSYENVPMYSCGTSSPSIYFTGQIKLYETTNTIEIHIGNKGVCPGWNNGSAVMGLHNYDGTVYVPPVNSTMHNASSSSPYNQWTMSNTAYRFQSPCAVNSGPCVVLPIGFKNFYGEQVNDVNKLYWQTETESNIKEYAIERSTDAINFTTIGYRLPENKPSEYSFDDVTFRGGIVNYYRITATEFNGQKKSTFIYPLGGSTSDLSVSEVYPNPASSAYNINVVARSSIELSIVVRNTFGTIIKESRHVCAAGLNTLNLESPVSSGVYVVEILQNDKVLSQQKLVVLK